MAKQKRKREKVAPRAVSFKIIENDVITDVLEMERPRLVVDYDQYLNLLWEANPEITGLLRRSPTVEKARHHLYSYLETAERAIFDVDNELHILEKATVRECIRVFKSIIGPINEKRTQVSALD